MRSEEVIGSSFSTPQYLRGLEVVGGPPYSPGATPVDHLRGFLLGSRILVGGRVGGVADVLVGDDDIGESCGSGVAPEFTVM